MRKSLALKTLLRSPVKTLLTFLLIASASFAFFSRVTDYAITSREVTNAKSFYHGVAALDNSVPFMDLSVGGGYGIGYKPKNKPWPGDEQIGKFTSLPGVTLADTRYMTAGMVEDYKRLPNKDYSDNHVGHFVLEGTYVGYKDVEGAEDMIELVFDEVTVFAGEVNLVPGEPVRICHNSIEKVANDVNPYSRKFFEGLKKGSRCLVIGGYNETDGSNLKTDNLLNKASFFDEKSFRIVEGLEENYLDTEPFAFYKEWIDAIKQNLYTYDIVYTSDMRAIPRFNEHNMVISEGRILTKEDTDSCVVSDLFLETYGLSVGDKVSMKFGDRLFSQNPIRGAQNRDAKSISNFVNTAKLEIVGTYRIVDDAHTRLLEADWTYTPSTIFVPHSLLSIEVPDDYETSMGEFSVFIENAHDIESFKEAAEPLVAKMGLSMRFSDGGWLSIKDSFETGALTSLLTTVLHIIGAALALLLASYLYIGRNKETYAIMRAMGVPGKTAGSSLVLPFLVLLAAAVCIGGAIGTFYTSKEAVGAIADVIESAPDGYVPDVTIPIGIIILCMLFELAFTSLIILFFLRKMKKISPLELLQGGVLRVGLDSKDAPDAEGNIVVPEGIDISKIPAVSELPQGRKYGAMHHVAVFTLRHMWRSIGKTVVSLFLTVVLTAGIGMFALARLAYFDAFYEVDVKNSVLEFASSAVEELSQSDLVEDFYCYNVFSVRINGRELNTPMVFTNDLDCYLTGDYTAAYTDGYDISALERTDAVCMVGKGLAETLGISPGDEIALLSDTLYSVLSTVYEDEEELQEVAEGKAVMYKVIGTIKSADAFVNTSIYTGITGSAKDIYGQPFPFGYCEFTLADNGRLDELELLLTNLKNVNSRYAPIASFYIDAEALNGVIRIRTLLESLFPIAVITALFIGMAGYLLVILQAAKEAAYMRVLGVTKKRVRCMLTLEQNLLCVTGIIFVVCGLVWYSPGLFARIRETLFVCYALYFLGCFCGAFAASVHITKGRVLELLQVKE